MKFLTEKLNPTKMIPIKKSGCINLIQCKEFEVKFLIKHS